MYNIYSWQRLAEKHHEMISKLTQLQAHILDEQLITWKRHQQLAGNGSQFEGSLETLQQWWAFSLLNNKGYICVQEYQMLFLLATVVVCRSLLTLALVKALFTRNEI